MTKFTNDVSGNEMNILKIFSKLAVLSCATLMVHTTSAAAGTKDGSGGKGVLCGGKLATLDLYEARAKGNYPVTLGSFEEDLKNYGTEMAKHFAENSTEFSGPLARDMMLKVLKSEIVSRFRDIAPGQRLPLTTDATVPRLPSGCSEVQIAIYSDDEGVIHRDPEYWSKLAPIEQAALVIHEMIYHRAREYKIRTSDETRAVIGLLFSGRNPEPLLAPIWSAPKKIWCGAGVQKTSKEIYEMFGVDETRNGVVGVALYFRAFKSVYVTSRISTFLPGITLDQFMAKKFEPFNVVAQNDLLKKTWNVLIYPSPNDNIVIRSVSPNDPLDKPDYSIGFCRWE